MSEKPSPASQRAQKMLTDLFTEPNDYRAGVVVLSYRRPGAGERDVSFGHAALMRTSDGAIDFVLMSKTLRELADQLDAVVSDPKKLAQNLRGVKFR